MDPVDLFSALQRLLLNSCTSVRIGKLRRGNIWRVVHGGKKKKRVLKCFLHNLPSMTPSEDSAEERVEYVFIHYLRCKGLQNF